MRLMKATYLAKDTAEGPSHNSNWFVVANLGQTKSLGSISENKSSAFINSDVARLELAGVIMSMQILDYAYSLIHFDIFELAQAES